MKLAVRFITTGIITVLFGTGLLFALNPSLDASQYGHTSWTARDGFSVGAIFAMAQPPDGYLWLATEFGLFRFDGIKAIPWQPPRGQELPDKPYALLVTRDGTLWIGTFAGLVTWNGTKLSSYPEIGKSFVTSLLEDREGTVWVGTYSAGGVPARVCAIRSGSAQCQGDDGAFGSFVWSLGEDGAGTIWAGAESGVWRCNPGPAQRLSLSGMRVGDFVRSDDDRLLVGISGAGLKRLVGDKLEPYPIYSATNRNALLEDQDVDSNKVLRDRDGGVWIGTHQRGLIHIHHGRTDVFTKSDGLSSNISCSLFEDREGNIWFGSTRGLDRFRELPAITISSNQGLSSNSATSLVPGKDGSVWIGSHDGLTQWKNGQPTVFRKGNGLPDDSVQSMFEDDSGRLWATFKGYGLSYLTNGKFVGVPGVPSEEVYSIGGDDKDNVWLSGNKGLSHVRDRRVLETFPWSIMGRQQQAKLVIPDAGGVWLAFWKDGGVLYFKDGKVHNSYGTAEGLGKGPVGGLQRDHDGAFWVSTQQGGLSRIKDGRVSTLSTKNGLPCDSTHWSIEDDDHSLWIYTACGLVRITRSELDAWIADPKRRSETTIWNAADGVGLTAASPGYFNPAVAKSTDGKLWFLGKEEGVAVLDPHHLPFNRLPPPVHIEQVIADQKTYWQNLPGEAVSHLRLPARVRDLAINYSALSLTDLEKVHFRYKLEGQDREWREVINERKVQYSNLRPGTYRFRVIASNNSGVWNEQGDTLEFSINPAYYQTYWFRALCVTAFLLLLWAVYQYRVQQLNHEFEVTLDARVGERTRIARDLHDTLLQSFHGLLLRFQTVSLLLPDRPIEAKEKLDSAIDQAASAITEGRDAVQGLRASTVERNDLALAINTLGEELQTDSTDRQPVTFRVAVEGQPKELHPILRDEIYKIAAEALRNAFHHARAKQIEVEIRYDDDQFRLRVRDDGKGMDAAVLSSQGLEGHYGLRGMRERATLIQGKLVVWSEVDAGTEVELRVPAGAAYKADRKLSWWSRKVAPNA